MASKRTLYVNWCAINGAAQGKRKLILRANDSDMFTCPVDSCLHKDFKGIANQKMKLLYVEETTEISTNKYK